MIPSFLTNWGVMSNASSTDESLKGKCLCGCHPRSEPRPKAAKKRTWCEACFEERNQPWTEFISSIV